MQVDNKILDDLARVAGGAFGALSGLREEAESQVRQQFERILSGMDVVRREDFDAVSEMAAKARSEQETLVERVTALEALVATLVAERELAEDRPKPRRPLHPASPGSPHGEETSG
ncbi:accessory factor UbiK family protein [Arenibaculum sp.]|jgi:BMFP domain-containing protein YqiC|uniref:accessory factor UbiK family protein n=1 Tax=Arenibaculum sp. TaxID=2865862 RepID=UPI002E13CB47|nr:accessory factor UbiK family protein [Arenibaculum sp.]